MVASSWQSSQPGDGNGDGDGDGDGDGGLLNLLQILIFPLPLLLIGREGYLALAHLKESNVKFCYCSGNVFVRDMLVCLESYRTPSRDLAQVNSAIRI